MSKLVVLKNLELYAAAVMGGAASQIHRPHFLQPRPFSSSPSLNPLKNSSVRVEFTVNYLINSCGFTPEKALSASKYVKFQVADNPDSVLTFFKSQCLTQTQISRLVRGCPPLLLSNPEKIFSPKIEFLKSKGISTSDIALIISRSPIILKTSLEKQLIPSFNFFCNLLQSEEKTIAAIKRFAGILICDLEICLMPNIAILQESGMPIRNIQFVLRYNPRTLVMNCDKFRLLVEKVKEMGFDPSKMQFLSAIHALRSMKKSTWDRKVEVYRRWGWSESDIAAAFRKNTWCMTLSEDKITSVMEFWVIKMGWESSLLAHRPVILALSLQKRIVPRCAVYQDLVSKGIVKPGDVSLAKLLEYPEKRFLQRFINRYEEDAPELLNLYKEKLDLAK